MNTIRKYLKEAPHFVINLDKSDRKVVAQMCPVCHNRGSFKQLLYDPKIELWPMDETDTRENRERDPELSKRHNEFAQGLMRIWHKHHVIPLLCKGCTSTLVAKYNPYNPDAYKEISTLDNYLKKNLPPDLKQFLLTGKRCLETLFNDANRLNNPDFFVERELTLPFKEFFDVVEERYTSDNVSLLKYMKNKPFSMSDEIWRTQFIPWVMGEHAALEAMKALMGYTEDYPTEEDMESLDSDLFYDLPVDIQDDFKEHITGIGARAYDNQAEAPTWMHLDLSQFNLLPRQTWLVHFSNNAQDIANVGFKYGMDQMDKLGLTTWFDNEGFDKKYGGYNFAFNALSRDAKYAAKNGKYGDDAVLFQNSGVEAFHFGDDETQVMFHGKDVDPYDTVLIRSIGDGEFGVVPKGDWKYSDHRDYVFQGPYERVVQWVMQNFNQYRKLITGR